MTSHDLAVPDESQGRQAFCEPEGISHHLLRAQKHNFEESSQDDFTHIVLTNINMTRELSANWIFVARNNRLWSHYDLCQRLNHMETNLYEAKC